MAVSCLSSESDFLEIKQGGPFIVIGERINPTGKKDLQANLRKGESDLAVEMALSQASLGARILDINVGMAGINEKEMMVKIVEDVSEAVSLPLCIDSGYPEVVEAALRVYPGRALINSISLESAKTDALLSIAKKYGAMFIVLPVSDEGLPDTFEKKKAIINDIVKKAEEYGFVKEDMLADALVGTVGANLNSAKETVELIKYCKEEANLFTVCGLSNISFGLPNRKAVNAAYASIAINAGLTMAIANPSNELLMDSIFAADMLAAKTGADISYIERMSKEQKAELEQETSLSYDAVLKGRKKDIEDILKDEIKAGKTPDEIINGELIPAIKEVGNLFEKQRYFLPQLMGSAETMKKAVEYLEPLLEKGSAEASDTTVVIATVEGDVHDIGKNLVALMIKNYGFRVIDLGKDVPKEIIVETAIKEKADFIALSALMTTTMVRMEEVIEYVKERNIDIKVIIGGAVVTEEYAKEIGADGYSKDAAAAAVLVESLRNKA